jgi:hypothetical protein
LLYNSSTLVLNIVASGHHKPEGDNKDKTSLVAPFFIIFSEDKIY